jgi:hypothetical protein
VLDPQGLRLRLTTKAAKITMVTKKFSSGRKVFVDLVSFVFFVMKPASVSSHSR